MDQEDYEEWIDRLVAAGVYASDVGEDFKAQRRLFDAELRGSIQDGAVHGAVGCVANVVLNEPTAPELVARASVDYPGRAIYFESVSATP